MNVASLNMIKKFLKKIFCATSCLTLLYTPTTMGAEKNNIKGFVFPLHGSQIMRSMFQPVQKHISDALDTNVVLNYNISNLDTLRDSCSDTPYDFIILPFGNLSADLVDRCDFSVRASVIDEWFIYGRKKDKAKDIKKVAIVMGSGSAEHVSKSPRYSGYNLVVYESYSDALIALFTAEVDALVGGIVAIKPLREDFSESMYIVKKLDQSGGGFLMYSKRFAETNKAILLDTIFLNNDAPIMQYFQGKLGLTPWEGPQK